MRIRAQSGAAIGIWLFVIAAMIALMVLVGGLTRLTGSGLSITEWQPVTGIVPPLGDAAWQAEFLKYQGTPQYELLNRGIGLAGFQSLYWWEWGHRFLGRLLGVVFLVPFIVFWRQGRIGPTLAFQLAIIFLLGAAQGLLGWWMVQSGLSGARVAVSQYRLAAHLGLAMLLFGYIFRTALATIGARRSNVVGIARLKPWATLLAGLVFVQILLGALMSGLKAGLAYPSWPDYAGMLAPPGLYDLSPWWLNHFENPALVNFQHRTLGLVIAIFVVGLYVRLLGRGDKPLRIAGIHVVLLTLMQIGLGIFTVLNKVPLALAAAHQLVALGLFAATLWWAYVLRDNPGSRQAAIRDLS